MPARYTQDSIDRMRDAVDMVELVSARTELRRVGSQWMGRCPFHDERTPSFSVDAVKKVYNCFGCEARGDAITFVRETEALDFPEAVELLAERHNVELRREREDPREEERRRRRERLLALLEKTAGFYATYLAESSEARRAREYLEERGLTIGVLRSFRVGYAPKAWDRLLTGAQREGFKPEELLAAGLAQRARSGALMDRFRERIMFPLADARGRVLGFGARAMREQQGPKYLNTSENEIYHKGRQLFGIDLARAAAAKGRRVVVVEGYTDVLALHQAGLEETVAIMGTALTQEQLAELARAVGREGRVYLALDADRSGQEAMLRAARIAQDRDVELRVVKMPEGTDPADLVAREGPKAISRRLNEALSVLEFATGRALAKTDLDTPEGRDRALAEVRGLIAAAPGPAQRDHLVRVAADRLDMRPVDLIARMEGPIATSADGDVGRGRTTFERGAARPLDAEQRFLADCLAAGEVGLTYLSRLSDDHLSSALLRRVRDHLTGHPEDPLAHLSDDDRELARVVAAVALRAEEEEAVDEARLRIGYLPLELRRIEREVRQAGRQGDFARQAQLAAAKQRVRSEMDTVMGQAT
ncbi:MAG: DNA primase [Actinomycetota bacterium]|nr:DNA primase [Actinomycetota bacterium]